MVQPLWDRSWPRRCACALGIAGAAWHGALAQTQMAARNPLLDLSLEDLAKVEITSVSRRPERLLDAAASVYVISAEDIRRSGASSLAEVLRLAPNLQVARGSASQYAISARGMNTNTGNKLQVLLDGRVLYTPLFSGVFWDVQDTLLEDIERVEVISGPGATLWGANAVNGVINIVTREARREPEALASVQAGNRERSAAARYGSAAGEQGAWRAYAKHREYAELPKENGAAARDGWRISQAGLRFDGGPAAQRYTLQGDLYDGDSDQPGSAGRRTLRGANLLARVTRALDGGAAVQAQLYVDHVERHQPLSFGERLDTVDLDLQHRFAPLPGHLLVWGGGLRQSRDRIDNLAVTPPTSFAFLPADKTLRQQSLYAQDTYALVPERWTLTLGLRADHNVYSGTDVQPNVRLAWRVAPEQLLWASLARAARAPSRIDREFYAPAQPPFALAGGPEFESERVDVAEVGWRATLGPRASLSATLFHHDYRKLRSLQPAGSTPLPLVLANRIAGHAEGFETWGDWLPADTLRLRAGLWWQHKALHVEAGGAPDPIGLRDAGNDPRYQAFVRASADLAANWELDAALRRVGALPDPAVPAYSELDLALRWRPTPRLDVSIGGNNLLHARHAEFGSAATRSLVERSLYARLTWSH